MMFADSVYDFGCDRTKDPEGTTVVGDGVGSLKVCSTGGDGFNVKEDSELVERLAAITAWMQRNNHFRYTVVRVDFKCRTSCLHPTYSSSSSSRLKAIRNHN